MNKEWTKKSFVSADEFLKEVLLLGNPLEVSLVGSFDKEGRGSRLDCELPFHRDGDYTTKYKDKISWVCLYCIRSGEAKTLIKLSDGKVDEISLKEGDAVIINNKKCLHSREGKVGDRLLLRVWIECQNTNGK